MGLVLTGVAEQGVAGKGKEAAPSSFFFSSARFFLSLLFLIAALGVGVVGAVALWDGSAGALLAVGPLGWGGAAGTLSLDGVEESVS